LSKRNKLRYQSRGNPYPPIALSGRVLLRHHDDEAIAAAAKGDIRIYLSTDSIPHNTHIGDYEAMGFEGYLKAEVHDGKGWKVVSLEEFFPGREYYFGKRERPADTYLLCLGTLQAAKGIEVIRTYREHYRVGEASGQEAHQY